MHMVDITSEEDNFFSYRKSAGRPNVSIPKVILLCYWCIHRKTRKTDTGVTMQMMKI